MRMDSVEKLPPAQLVQLLDLSGPAHWTAEDAAVALRQQLAAPLLPDLAAAPGARREQLEAAASGMDTFAQALLSPPNITLLHAIKQWARHTRNDSATPLSPGPATVLYYAALASALVHFSERITSLSTDQMAEGFEWAAAQIGANPLSSLFPAAMKCL
ncbi:MAG TPA: hypothetical protein VHM90_04645 [Phycisphaerae bacterium]|jgi:hypothetical protein|nr:hypothetical protein [Phycisphaerae bacterium]